MGQKYFRCRFFSHNVFNYAFNPNYDANAHWSLLGWVGFEMKKNLGLMTLSKKQLKYFEEITRCRNNSVGCWNVGVSHKFYKGNLSRGNT